MLAKELQQALEILPLEQRLNALDKLGRIDLRRVRHKYDAPTLRHLTRDLDHRFEIFSRDHGEMIVPEQHTG